MADLVELIPDFEKQESDLVLSHFDHADAWRLGNRLATAALEAGHAVAIDIRRPGLVLFRAALPGSAPDQEEWLRRKAAVTLRFEESSALAAARLAASGKDPIAQGWLDPAQYALTGGSFPIRVAGVGVVAAVTVSGLASMADHDLIVAAVAEHLAEDRATRRRPGRRIARATTGSTATE